VNLWKMDHVLTKKQESHYNYQVINIESFIRKYDRPKKDRMHDFDKKPDTW